MFYETLESVQALSLHSWSLQDLGVYSVWCPTPEDNETGYTPGEWDGATEGDMAVMKRFDNGEMVKVKVDDVQEKNPPISKM